MTLKQYLITMLIGTILCWTAWIFVIFNVDPLQSNLMGFIFFYLSLFLSLLGTISMLAFLLHRFFSRELLPIYKYVQKSFRHAVIISSILVLLLFLQGIQVLTIWNLGAFILIILLIISFFLSTKFSRQGSNDLIQP